MAVDFALQNFAYQRAGYSKPVSNMLLQNAFACQPVDFQHVERAKFGGGGFGKFFAELWMARQCLSRFAHGRLVRVSFWLSRQPGGNLRRKFRASFSPLESNRNCLFVGFGQRSPKATSGGWGSIVWPAFDGDTPHPKLLARKQENGVIDDFKNFEIKRFWSVFQPTGLKAGAMMRSSIQEASVFVPSAVDMQCAANVTTPRDGIKNTVYAGDFLHSPSYTKG